MLYWIGCPLIRVILALTVRMRARGLAAGAWPGGYLLACSHVSHLRAARCYRA